MIKKLLLASLTLFSVSLNSQNTLVSYGFANITTSSGSVDPTPLPAVTGLSLSAFSANGVSANPNATGRFSFTGWPAGATNAVDTYSMFTGALTPTAYYEVSLAPLPGYSLTLNSINFSMRRSGTGVRNFSVRSSVDSYSANLPAVVTSSNMSVVSPDVFFWTYDATNNGADLKGNSVTLGGPAYTNLSNPVKFRFYAWNAEGSGGTFSIDSVVFYGLSSNVTQTNVTTSAPKQESQNIAKALVFPNPVTDGLATLECTAPIRRADVLNILGETVLSESYSSSSTTRTIDLRHLPAGSYFVRMLVNGAVETKKIVVSN